MTTINRRELLWLGGSTLILGPTLAHATIPPPPISNWYLIFIADGIYRISGLDAIELPASAGTCQNYSAQAISNAVDAKFTFTGLKGVGAWQMLTNQPIYEWFEAYDKRNDRFVRIWKGERFEVKFTDGSRVKVKFNGPNSTMPFQPILGTERLPNGTRLNGRIGVDRPATAHKSRDDGGGVSLITPIIPSVGMYVTGHASQVLPW